MNEQQAISQFLGQVGTCVCQRCGKGTLHDFVPRAIYERWRATGQLRDDQYEAGVTLWSPCSDVSPYTLILAVRVVDLPTLRAEISQHCHLCDRYGSPRPTP